jgi:hypothetical protein
LSTGQSTDTNALDVKLTDNQLLELIKKPLQDSETYWNKTFGLEEAQQNNKKLWLPEHWKGEEVFDYQEMSTYQDPRIFTSTETITATVNARVPQIEIMPAQDTEISLQVARDLQRVCTAYIEKHDVMELFKLSVRGLQIKRGGFIKLRFDASKGEHGEIVCEFVQREDCIVDMDAKMGEIPRFFGHRIRNKTVEELIAQLPDAEQKILEMAGCQRRNKQGNLVAYKKQLGIKKDVIEVWFRYMEDGQTKSGICWIDENCQHVLDKGPNPNWNYDAKKGTVANILDEPAPPFIPINFLNDGSSYFDQTTLIEQATSLQRILDKRGFQIMENADQAGSGLVFNTQMIKKSDIQKLTGSPDERVGVKGDVREAVARVAPPPLPNYVIEDKIDARNEIDNVFATHDITRGERSKNPTLGQDNLQLRGDTTRMDEIARAVERQASGFCRYLVQMMKVYYTEDHYFKAVGEDGQFDFVVMRGDLIENGIDIRVAAGSMLPIDKTAQQKWVSDLVTAGLIDPLTVYEVMTGGNLPSPKKLLERWVMSRSDPLSYAGLAKAEDFSREALLDIQVLNGGKMPKQRDTYSAEYLKFMNSYMALSGEFNKQPDLVKNMYIEHLSMVQESLAAQMQLMMSQMPTQEELDMQAQKTAEQAVVQQQMTGGQPDSEQPQPSAEGGDPAQLAERLAMMKQGAPAPA